MFGNLNLISKLLIILTLIINISCGSAITKMVLPELNDGDYDSEFPYKNASKELQGITETIRMIHGMAFYRSYTFDISTKLKRSDSRFKNLKDYADSETLFHETFGGTATVIYSGNDKAAFLTCAHILDFPDTLIFYFNDSIGQKTKYISGIAVKTKQVNYLPELNSETELKIIALDKNKDLAILGGKFETIETLNLKSFNYPVGNSGKLNWGTFVYLFGYPLNNKMVTKGIVSPPKNEKSTIFYVDANINKGFSGGLVLAIKDGIPNFELVGIVKSGAGFIDYYLKPSDGDRYPLINSKIPYTDKIYVDKNLNLRYGITNVISIETVLEFLENNIDNLEENGFELNYFFN